MNGNIYLDSFTPDSRLIIDFTKVLLEKETPNFNIENNVLHLLYKNNIYPTCGEADYYIRNYISSIFNSLNIKSDIIYDTVIAYDEEKMMINEQRINNNHNLLFKPIDEYIERVSNNDDKERNFYEATNILYELGNEISLEESESKTKVEDNILNNKLRFNNNKVKKLVLF